MKRNYLRYISFILFICFIMTACNSNSKSDLNSTKEEGQSEFSEADVAPPAEGFSESEEFVNEETKYDKESKAQETTEDGSYNDSATTDTDSENISSSSTVHSSNEGFVKDSRKLIRKVYLDLETLEYDTLISSIDRQIDLLQGYVESSIMDGNNYNSEEHLRYSKMVVRVPKDKVNDFINTVSKKGNVVNKEESSEDVTLEYVDAKSHQEALKIEYDRILELLKKAEKLEDIFTLETKLSELRYEIESYESQLRTYDNLVDYATVTLTITEVREVTMTPVIEKEKTVWERIETGFSKSVSHITDKAIDLVVYVAVNIIVIALMIVVCIVGVLFLRRKLKKR